DPEVIYEFETTDTTSETVADFVLDVRAGDASPSHGTCDWSLYLMNRMP
ncbi:MAG: hypothetical protein XD88_1257, partial [Methanocalculus sp. 52_23]